MKHYFRPSQPYRFTEAEQAQLATLTDAEIEAAAAADPENPPIGEARLNRMVLARDARLIREATGLSQTQFAARYRISLARPWEYEQARSEPDPLVQMVYRLIREDPE